MVFCKINNRPLLPSFFLRAWGAPSPLLPFPFSDTFLCLLFLPRRRLACPLHLRSIWACLIFSPPETTREEIEATFTRLVQRGDVGLIIMNQPVADQIRPTVAGHTLSVPMVLEIPSSGGGSGASIQNDVRGAHFPPPRNTSPAFFLFFSLTTYSHPLNHFLTVLLFAQPIMKRVLQMLGEGQ